MTGTRRRSTQGPSSVARAFEVLDLFSPAHPLLRVDDLALRLGYTRSTAYRYVRELCEAGLLVPTSNSNYALGPRVIELEQLLRMTDPLYLAARQVLPALRSDDSVLMVQSLYSEKVLCIYAEGPEMLEQAGRRIKVKRTRGTPFPLFRGAASLALLAWMPGDPVREIYLRHVAEIAERGLGAGWEEFRATLGAIRRRGYATSGGQIVAELFGIAVPIVTGPERRAIGSLVRVAPHDARAAEGGPAELQQAAVLQGIARNISAEYLRASRTTHPEPPRPRRGQ